VGLGTEVADSDGLFGDARGASISFCKSLDSPLRATPLSSFALAGYLGFAALAKAVGIPAFRAELATDQLDLPIDTERVGEFPPITLIGTGNVGQACLALLWFLPWRASHPEIHLIDRDRFEPPNFGTQVLFDDESAMFEWKADFLGRKLAGLGMNVTYEQAEVDWTWRRTSTHPGIALVAVDDFDVRRMVMSAGYDWAVEAGIGDDFTRPRVTWHSMPAGPAAARIFSVRHHRSQVAVTPSLERTLRETPGACGWLTFQDITASAPCLGIAAAAFAISALVSPRRTLETLSGGAILWSPLLPPLVERSMNVG
jgi:hypothetical protein